MKFKREIENKYILQDISFEDAKRTLSFLYTEMEPEKGISTDTFWKAPGVDFIRLRANTQELTVKITDRGSIQNRLEEDLQVPTLELADRWATAVFGPKVGVIEKTFYIYYLEECVLSLYTVTGRPEVFFEVEVYPEIPEGEKVLDIYSRDFEKLFDVKRETRSLFQICFPGA